MIKNAVLLLLCVCGLGACAVAPADAAPAESAEAAPLLPSPPPCAQALTATRVSTVHHLSMIGGVFSGGLVNQAQWLPSAANQTMDVSIPLDSGVELDLLTLSAVNAPHSLIQLYRLDSPVQSPTFLGAFNLASITANGSLTFDTYTLSMPHQISSTFEQVGTGTSSYYLEITSDNGGEGFGPLTVTTSVLSISGGGTGGGSGC